MIAIGAVNDIKLYREMIEAGISDYLVKPVSDRALDRRHQPGRAAQGRQPAMRRRAPTGRLGGRDKRSVISVLGTRGGVGAHDRGDQPRLAHGRSTRSATPS